MHACSIVFYLVICLCSSLALSFLAACVEFVSFVVVPTAMMGVTMKKDDWLSPPPGSASKKKKSNKEARKVSLSDYYMHVCLNASEIGGLWI
jgi:hypothetical protein